MIFYFIVALFTSCIFYFVWLRWRMRASKGRFAFTVVTTMLTCLLSGLSAMSLGLPTALVSKASEAIGWGPVESSAPSFVVMALTIAAMFCIYRFGSVTIKNWEAPPRVSEIDLAERYLENSIAALSLEQIRLIVKGQSDPYSSDAVANWKEKISEPPAPVPTNILLRDMLVEAMTELKIPDGAWREDGKLWVGEKQGLLPTDTKSLMVLIFDAEPDVKVLEERLNLVANIYGAFNDFELIALFMADSTTMQADKILEASGKSIRVMSSRTLIYKGLDLINYARTIINAFERTKVGGTEATLQGSYVELTVALGDGSHDVETLGDNITRWLDDTSGKQVAVTGEYGQGKSTGLLKFCYEWAKRFVDSQAQNERVPLLIELRGQNPSETDSLGFLSSWCARHRLSPQQVYNLIKSGEALVIFEGFDELRNSGRAYYRHQHFNALWKFAFPGTKLLFTGRPNFFLDEAEANRTLRNQEARRLGGGLYTDVWKLKKLTPAQIEEACRSYDPEVADGIKASAENNVDFLDIVSRPSMLPVVATIWGDVNELRSEGNQLTGAALIEKYIQAVFARKEAELERDQTRLDAPTGSRYLVLPKQIREFLTICVAWRMSGLRLKNTIPRSEIVGTVREVYDILIKISKSSGVSPEIAEGMIDFEQRYKDESPAERVEVIAAEIASAGLLVPDPAGGASNLRFPHKQFFEFLIAKAIAIRSKPGLQGAQQILERCSPGAGISTRLNNEPNAVGYLVECIGLNFKTISTRWQRFSLRLYLVQLLAVNRVFRSFFRSTTERSNRLYRNDAGYSVHNLEPNWSSVEIMLATMFRLFSWTSASLGILILLLLYMDAFSEPITRSIQTIFLRNATDPETEGLGAEPVTVLLAAIMLGIMLAAMMMLATMMMLSTMMRFLYDDNFESMIFSFFHAHWEKSGACPTSRIEEINLAMASLSRGRVQLKTNKEDSTDYTRFLYPASELGGGGA